MRYGIYMMQRVELNLGGKELPFKSVAAAMEAGRQTQDGFDVWVNGELYFTRIRDFRTGQFTEETNFHALLAL
jgi:hypothetical protein